MIAQRLRAGRGRLDTRFWILVYVTVTVTLIVSVSATVTVAVSPAVE
jgi:hypothetical protein